MQTSAHRAMHLMAVVLSLYAASACNIAGPTGIRYGRGEYNQVLQKTAKEQLLLNLVRLRYGDPPMFLEVENLVTSYEMSANASGLARVGTPTFSPNEGGLVQGGAYLAERPTVSYRPIQGEAYVRQLMTPLDVRVIVLLVHSGWSIDHVLRMTTQRINGIPNAPTASGPTPETLPQFRDFQGIVAALSEFQRSGGLQVGTASNGGGIELLIQASESQRPLYAKVKNALKLDPSSDHFEVVNAIQGGDKRIAICTRSPLAMMNYLSQGVAVPQRDCQDGHVIVTRDGSGAEFDWSTVMGDLLKVRCSDTPPLGTYVSVRYRDQWFYIEDHDLASKKTFLLLTQLLAVQSVDLRNQPVILTLPVGR